MSWGMGTRKTPDPGPPAKKSTSLVGVGKMPWVKNGAEPGAAAPPTSNGNSGAAAPRRSRFGPQVSVGATIPPPSMVTQAPTLAGATEPIEAGHNTNFPPPPPPMVAPPPGARDGPPRPEMTQSGWSQPGHPGPEASGPPGPGMGPPPSNGGAWYGYGGPMAPPELAPPQEVAPPKVVR